MISFYPGPSQVHPAIPAYVKDAFKLGILSMNHRSESFMKLYETTASLLKRKLNIPSDYTVYFSSSATECWEMIAQSVIKKGSLHVYNGSFGKKWYDYTKKLVPGARHLSYDPDQEIPKAKVTSYRYELICITQNETSNGTRVSSESIRYIQRKNPNSLIAIDATSSMGGEELKFKNADIWFASVQKCFGLPAGLAIMVCSPSAIERIKLINESRHYNSLINVHHMMEKWQTTHTPNVLGIYLLMRALKDSRNIKIIHKRIENQANAWQAFFRNGTKLKLFIQNQKVLSSTVLTISGSEEWITKVKLHAKKSGFILGEGYGELKKNTFRIANFPALHKSDIMSLKNFLKTYL